MATDKTDVTDSLFVMSVLYYKISRDAIPKRLYMGIFFITIMLSDLTIHNYRSLQDFHIDGIR